MVGQYAVALRSVLLTYVQFPQAADGFTLWLTIVVLLSAVSV